MKLKVERVETRKKSGPGHPRVFIFPVGESLLENLEGRFRRPYEAYRKEVMPEVLKELGLEGTEFRWSQKAGCSCGCSPGFILKERYSEARGYIDDVDFFVDVTEEDDEAGEEDDDSAAPVYSKKMQCIDDNHYKQWEVQVLPDGSTGWRQLRQWGRIGKKLSEKEFTFGSLAEAVEDAKKMVDQKMRKGYLEA